MTDPTEETPPAGEDSELTRTRREAATYRARLRDEQHQVTLLTAQRDQAQRGLVEALVAPFMADPGAIWHYADLDDFRADDGGTIDPEKTESLVKRITFRHSYLKGTFEQELARKVGAERARAACSQHIPPGPNGPDDGLADGSYLSSGLAALKQLRRESI
ncbi:MAG: hypothetical protein AB7V42_12670 [Thermoleophilia bacterium]